jgi:nicotinamidase-related amidase
VPPARPQEATTEIGWWATVLDRRDAQLLLIDLHPDLMPLSRTVPEDALRTSATALAHAAALLGIPATESMLAGLPHSSIPEIADRLSTTVFFRTTPHAFSDSATREALSGNGRPVVGIGGILTEIGVLNNVLGAVSAGYDVHVLVDLCGGICERSERAAFDQMQRAGATLSSTASFVTALIRDFTTSPDQQALESLYPLLLANLAAEESPER